MSIAAILLAQFDLTFPSIFLLPALAVVAIALAGICGVFRRNSVLGPARFNAEEPLQRIWFVTILCIYAWFFLPYLLSVIMLRSAGPTTQPASVAANVWLNLFAACACGGSVLLANYILRRGALAKIGFNLHALRHGWKIGLLGAAIVLPIMFFADAGISSLYELCHYKPPAAHELLEDYAHEPSMSLHITIILLAVFIAPIAEELLFRGQIQTAIVRTLSAKKDSETDEKKLARDISTRWIAIFITSFLFMLVHGQLWLMPPIFILSLFLGYAYERTANLWVPILIHAAFNAANVIFFLYLQSS